MGKLLSFTDKGGLILSPNQFLGVFSSEPTGTIDGQTYINSTSNTYWLYGGGIWWQLQTVTAGGVVTYRTLLENGDNLTYEDGNIMRTE